MSSSRDDFPSAASIFNFKSEIIGFCIAILIVLAFIFFVIYTCRRNLPTQRPPLPGGAKKWVEELELVALPATISEREQLGLRAADECCCCRSEFQEGEEVRVLPCYVVMHHECAFKNFKIYHICPLRCVEPPSSAPVVDPPSFNSAADNISEC